MHIMLLPHTIEEVDMKDSDSMFIFNVYENEGELSQSSLTESPRPNPLIQLPKPLLCYTYINIA